MTIVYLAPDRNILTYIFIYLLAYKETIEKAAKPGFPGFSFSCSTYISVNFFTFYMYFRGSLGHDIFGEAMATQATLDTLLQKTC